MKYHANVDTQQTIPKIWTDRSQLVRVVCFLLAVITLALYWPVRHFEFNNYDDAPYVTQNPYVQQGITTKSITWAFTTGYFGTWHPLTWISHQLDSEIYGPDAGGHHFTSVLFHVANTLLLFLLLQRWTDSLGRSAFVAALFAWHPLHVESVAWVAERKDVLSAFFWLLALFAYGGYAEARRSAAKEKPSKSCRAWLYYALALLFFALGLMAKPMLVSLPFVLVFLDYWPLRRFPYPFSRDKALSLLREKIPFLLLAAASSAITFATQRNSGAVQDVAHYPFAERAANAVVSYASYLGKLVWPAKLAVFYPYRHHLPPSEVAGAAALLVSVSTLAFVLARKHPALLIGWLWFLVTLVPVIGLVQVGEQAMADRYTYLPAIGIFLIAAWEIPPLLNRASGEALSIGSAGIVLAGCLLTTAHQLRCWRNSITLFAHALEVTQNNAVAECNLGSALNTAGNAVEGEKYARAALRINPDYVEAENNLATALGNQGKYEEAARWLAAAIKSHPRYSRAYYNLGLVYLRTGRTDEAITLFRYFISISPDFAPAYACLGDALAKQGRFSEAIEQYHQALALSPKSRQALDGLASATKDKGVPGSPAALDSSAAREHEDSGIILALQGDFSRSEEQFAQALKLNPNSASVHYNHGNALLRQNKFREAAEEFTQALRLGPAHFRANFNLALAFTELGRDADAIKYYQAALLIKPDSAAALQKLAWALATSSSPQLRNAKEALQFAAEATQLAPNDPSVWDAQAAAMAEAGEYEEALAAATHALQLAADDEQLSKAIRGRLQLYQSRTAFHESPKTQDRLP